MQWPAPGMAASSGCLMLARCSIVEASCKPRLHQLPALELADAEQDYIDPFDWSKVPQELRNIPHRGQASVFNFSFELQDYTGACSAPRNTA